MPHFVVGKIQKALNNHGKAVKGANIHVFGIAYKRNIDDVRESPALDVIRLLKKLGAEVSYSDPYVHEVRLDNVDLTSQDALSSAKKADCSVIITDHSNFDYKGLMDAANLIRRHSERLRRFRIGQDRAAVVQQPITPPA